ncbi:MAG: Na(+)-translocating NADH-quinone reductase subunit C [Myxococcales bacterium]|nr:Na(+)-translocating NADH-quinone reductase subunit C [Myxococcales bacterium]MDD9966529.1 Na(+)-translocating NADH-quinone reductase subunit C [Myxococcales bacterium]
MHSTGFTVMFAAAVCGVCSVFVAGSAVSLKERQETNKVLDRQGKVLDVAGLVGEGEDLSAQEISARYEKNIKPELITLKTGEPAEGDAATFDQKRAASDPATSEAAPANSAKVMRLPNEALVFKIEQEGKLKGLIVPIEGKGLWSTLYGYLALQADARTIKGITFYQHGETPGLGGEVDNPRWKALWKDRLAFNEGWEPQISVKKGTAGSAEEDPYQVDGLSGATITSRGVTHLVQFWLGEHGYGPYLEKYRKANGIQ